jgi:hypothetical protein
MKTQHGLSDVGNETEKVDLASVMAAMNQRKLNMGLVM